MKKRYTVTTLPHLRLHSLSQKEHYVLVLVASGLNSKEISLELNVLPKSIDNYKNRIGKKLGIKGYKSLQCFAICNKEILLEWGKLLTPELPDVNIPNLKSNKLNVADMQEIGGGNGFNCRGKFYLFNYYLTDMTLFGLNSFSGKFMEWIL